MAFLALGTALCSALGAMILSEIALRAGGAMEVSRWRTLSASVLLILGTSLLGAWSSIKLGHLAPIAVSSLTSIIIAEPALNRSYIEVGARKTALLYALTAPFATALAWLILDEGITGLRLLGGTLVLAGICTAVMFGPRKASLPQTPRNNPPHAELHHDWGQYSFGVLAALGQAVGTLAIKPVMTDGASPVAVMAMRALIAAVVLWALCLRGPRISVPPLRVLAIVVAGSTISFVIGMSLLMASLSGTNVGVASTLAATTPVAVLPMLWIRTGKMPSWQAWTGAGCTILGIGLILLH